MPQYEVSVPGKGTFSVNSPTELTDQQVWLAVQRQLELPEPPAPPPPAEGGFFPSVKRGFLQTQMLVGDVLPAMLGKAVGAEDYAKKQWEEAAETQKRIEREVPAAVPSYKDISNFGDAWVYAKEAVGESLASIIPSLLTGGAAGLVARPAVAAANTAAREAAEKALMSAAMNMGPPTQVALEKAKQAAVQAGIDAAKRTAFRYEAAGGFAGSALQNIPEVYQNIKEETGKEDIPAALVAGGFNAALDSILPVQILKKIRGQGLSETEVMSAWYKRGAKGLGKGFLVEGATEAAQEGSSILAENFVAENSDVFNGKNLERVINAGLKGGLGGGVITAATNIATGKAPPEEQTDRQRIEQLQREIKGDIEASRAETTLEQAETAKKAAEEAEAARKEADRAPTIPEIVAIAQGENGYTALELEKQRLINLPKKTKEVRGAIDVIKELQERMTIEEIGRKAPSVPPVMDDKTIRSLGFVKSDKETSVYRQLLGKSAADEDVVNFLENYAETKAKPQTKERINKFLGRIERAQIPLTAEEAARGEERAGETVTEPSGAGAPVVSEPGAGAPAAGVGVPQPSGVVPPVAPVGEPPVGEGAAPAPVATLPVTPPPAPPVEPPAPPAAPPVAAAPAGPPVAPPVAPAPAPTPVKPAEPPATPTYRIVKAEGETAPGKSTPVWNVVDAKDGYIFDTFDRRKDAQDWVNNAKAAPSTEVRLGPDWALEKFGKPYGSTREAAANYSLNNLQTDLQQSIANPFPNAREQAEKLADLRSKIASIQAALPTLQQMDRQDQSQGTQRAILSGAKQELDAAVRAGTLTPEQAAKTVEEARATGNAIEAAEVVEKATEPTTITAEQLIGFGVKKTQPMIRRIAGKNMAVPADRALVLAELNKYINNKDNSPESRESLTKFRDQFEEVGRTVTVAPTKKRKPQQTVMESALLGRINMVGGLDLSLLSEFSEKKEIGVIGKNDRPLTRWINPMTDKGKLFRSGGMQDYGEIARVLEEAGYMEPGSVQKDPTEAGERAKRMILSALKKEDAGQTIGEMEEETRRRQEELAKMEQEEFDAENRAEIEAERQAIMEAEGLTPADLDVLEDNVNFFTGATEQTPERLAADMRAMGFTEQEIEDAVAEFSRKAVAAPAPEARAEEVAQTPAAPEAAEELELEAPTAEEIAAREKREADAREAEREEQKRLERKQKADAERDEFVLTGSDRPADVAAAAGQMGIFDAPNTQEALTEPNGPKKAEQVSAAVVEDALGKADLTPEETQRLETSYGSKVGSKPFLDRLVSDVQKYITKGAQAVAKNLRDSIGKIAKAVLGIAVVFNVSTAFPPKQVYAQPQVPAIDVTAAEQLLASTLDLNGRTLSPNAMRVANWIANSAKKDEISLLLDTQAGKLIVMKGPKIISDAPALFGKAGVGAINDRILQMATDRMADADRITPAGKFPAKMEKDATYGSAITFFPAQTGSYAIHRVYLGTPAERRAERLASSSAEDNNVSYGCVNVGSEFYDNVLAKLDLTGEANAYLLPSDPKQLERFFPTVPKYSLAEAAKPAPVKLSKETQAKIDELSGLMQKMLGKMGLKNVALNLAQDLERNGEYANRLITLALDATNPVRDLRHESLHAMKELGFFSDAQWATLTKMARDKWIDKYLKSRQSVYNGQAMSRYDAYIRLYGGDPSRDFAGQSEATQQAIYEEAIADAFGDFDATKAPPGFLQTMLFRMREFFRNIREAMGAANIDSAEDIFRRVEKGELKETAPAKVGAKSSLREPEKRGSWYVDATPQQQETLDRWEDDRTNGTPSNWQDLDIRPARENIYDSASGFFYDYEKAKGLFEIPIADIGPLTGYDSAKDKARIQNLAEQIKENREIEPVFVAVDPNGEAYLMEGQHRSRALELLGYKSVPARVIVSMDHEEQPSAKASLRAPQTEAFKRWFGDSKVVDAEGKPLALYRGVHGFESISEKALNAEAREGYATFASNNPAISSTYANPNWGRFGDERETGALVPVYVKADRIIEFPTRTDSKGWRTFDKFEFDRRAKTLRAGEVLVVRGVTDTGPRSNLDVDPERGWSYPSDIYAWRPGTSVKSATGNIGTYDVTKPDIRYSLRDAIGLYSELENKIAQGPNAAPAPQWKAYIKGLVQKGVKPEEIEWSGVNDWLDLQTGRVSKEALNDYLKQGGVRVEETVLGGYAGWTQEDSERLDDLERRERRDELTFAEQAELARLISRENAATEAGQSSPQNLTKYGQYTLPGGENYREVLLTLPAKSKLKPTEIRIEPRGNYPGSPGGFNAFVGDKFVGWGETEEEARTSAIERATPDVVGYQSKHWDQPNVIAHIRLNDRADADGNKVLFVEEIQSDWGQEGKKTGFLGDLIPQNTAWQAVDTLDTVRTRAEAEAQLQELQPFLERNREPGMENRLVIREAGGLFDIIEESRSATAIAPRSYGAPRAPFVTKTEGWLNLALKRIMVMAAEGGYDKVAFVNGEQSAERFSLDKQVDELHWRTSNGLRRATLDMKSGDSLTFNLDKSGVVESVEGTGETRYVGKSFDEIVGKELAEKVLSETRGVLSGDGLKVGGEGMKTFYDTIVPTAVKKLLPKVGGGQMGEVNLLKDSMRKFDRALMKDDLKRLGEEGFRAKYAHDKQPGFDVTPDMKQKVQTTGLPRFSLRDATEDDRRRSLNDKRVSPRLPTAVKATEDPLGKVRLQPDLETFKRDPAAFRHNIGLMSRYPNFANMKGTPDQRAEQMIEHMKENLLWLFNQWDKKLRDRSKLWYVGGNRIAHRWAEKYGIPPEQAAAIIAALSPQKDWFQNVSLAERTLDALVFNADTAWTPEMTQVFRERAWAKKFPLRKFRDKTLKEMYVPGDAKSLVNMAVWIRAWDEATNPQTARVITPEGNFSEEIASGKTGKPIAMRAQSFAAMVKTLQMMQQTDLGVISDLIGKNHKVRSFYNNIIAPYAGDDVTIDTHAVAAALMRPLGSSDLEVYHNFGSAKPAKKDKEGNILVPASPGTKNSAITGLYGTYAMYAEAYRRAAKEANVLPREMQSITWEAIRGLFRPEQKQAKLKQQTNVLWNKASKGEVSGKNAREQISEMVSGITDPAWAKSSAGVDESRTDSSYATELPRTGVPRGGPAEPAGRTGERVAGAIPRASLRDVPRANLRDQVDLKIVQRMDQLTVQREEKGFVKRINDAISPKNFGFFRQQALNRYEGLSRADRMKIEKMGGADILADASAESAALMSDMGAGITASALGVHDREGGAPVYKRYFVVEVNGRALGKQYTTKASADAAAAAVNGVVRERGFTTVSNFDGTVKGPVAILAPIMAKYKDPEALRLFQLYSMIKRGARLMYTQDNKGNIIEKLITADDVNNVFPRLEAQFPEFKKAHAEWIKYNDKLVDFMRDTGIISEQNAETFKMHGDYFPFYRQIDGSEDAIGPRIFQSIAAVKAPKKMKGSEIAVGDFLENMVRNTQSAVQAGIKNVASRRAAQIGMDVGIVEEIPIGTTPEAFNSFYVLENGLKKYYGTHDQLFIESIKSLNLPDMPFIGMLAGPANLLRNLVTKDPGFILANLMRDSLSAWATSGVKMTPLVDTMRNFGTALASDSPEFKALLNAGVIGGYEFSQNVQTSAKEFGAAIRKAAGVPTLTEKIASPVTSVWGALEKATTASDAATRMEIYKRTLAETGNEAEALYRALEVMNFNRKGSSAVIRILTAAVPFLNARMQGLDILYRAAIAPTVRGDTSERARQIQKTFFVRGAYLMALSAMYWLLTHDDEEYKKQEQETRDNYWLLPSLGIKIPIPFEVGVLFKVIPERILAYTFGDDTGRDLLQSMKRQLLSTLAFNPIPQTVLPAVETVTNFSFFTWRPIIPQGLENVAPEYQVGPGTSKLAEGIGKTLNLSPMRIDQLINGYTGTMGMYAVDLIDAIYNTMADSPKPSKRFEQMPVIRRFAVDPEARGTVTAYYDLKNAVDQVVRTENLLERTMDYENWGPYMQENMKLLASKDYVSDMEKTLKELREMKTMIRSSTMSADAKRDSITQINRMENALTANIQQLKKMFRE